MVFGILGKKPLFNLGGGLAGKLAESFIYNVIRDKVLPIPGNIVWCTLALHVEHTGWTIPKSSQNYS
jgi:hypothetical protein